MKKMILGTCSFLLVLVIALVLINQNKDYYYAESTLEDQSKMIMMDLCGLAVETEDFLNQKKLREGGSPSFDDLRAQLGPIEDYDLTHRSKTGKYTSFVYRIQAESGVYAFELIYGRGKSGWLLQEYLLSTYTVETDLSPQDLYMTHLVDKDYQVLMDNVSDAFKESYQFSSTSLKDFSLLVEGILPDVDHFQAYSLKEAFVSEEKAVYMYYLTGSDKKTYILELTLTGHAIDRLVYIYVPLIENQESLFGLKVENEMDTDYISSSNYKEFIAAKDQVLRALESKDFKTLYDFSSDSIQEILTQDDYIDYLDLMYKRNKLQEVSLVDGHLSDPLAPYKNVVGTYKSHLFQEKLSDKHTPEPTELTSYPGVWLTRGHTFRVSLDDGNFKIKGLALSSNPRYIFDKDMGYSMERCLTSSHKLDDYMKGLMGYTMDQSMSLHRLSETQVLIEALKAGDMDYLMAIEREYGGLDEEDYKTYFQYQSKLVDGFEGLYSIKSGSPGSSIYKDGVATDYYVTVLHASESGLVSLIYVDFDLLGHVIGFNVERIGE